MRQDVGVPTPSSASEARKEHLLRTTCGQQSMANIFCLVGKLAMDAYPELKHEMAKQTIRERKA